MRQGFEIVLEKIHHKAIFLQGLIMVRGVHFVLLPFIKPSKYKMVPLQKSSRQNNTSFVIAIQHKIIKLNYS